MRTAVLASTVLAGAALALASVRTLPTSSWLLALWAPWLIVTVYAWRNYRPNSTSTQQHMRSCDVTSDGHRPLCARDEGGTS